METKRDWNIRMAGQLGLGARYPCTVPCTNAAGSCTWWRSARGLGGWSHAGRPKYNILLEWVLQLCVPFHTQMSVHHCNARGTPRNFFFPTWACVSADPNDKTIMYSALDQHGHW